MRGWAWRWFVLQDNILTYYTSKEKRQIGEKRGQLSLEQALLNIEEDCNFSVTVDDHTYHFQAPDIVERDKWVSELDNAIRNSKTNNQLFIDENGDIQRRIEEAEQYLQLIEKIQIETQNSSATEAATLATLTSGLIENGAEGALMLRAAAGSSKESNRSKQVDETKNNSSAEIAVKEKKCDSMSDFSPIAVSHQETLTSSDDEFHDCDDVSEHRVMMSGQEPVEFMEEENDRGGKEGEGVEAHKSVILHLIKQVRIGMDLTTVVLPTFILERRSLLEMYSDFFAHPDFFSMIPTFPTPRERLIAVIKWYLTSFHAGRNGSVAKKPYNPIIGETFRCFWKTGSPDSESPLNKRGPVPWSKEDDVSFLAEQVSHHPPVSAFYAENVQKRIQFSGHIWTKSQFHGLSIGVENIGNGKLELLDLNESYELTFPCGYCRSILTVPWVELGGDTKLTSSTGYRADVKFHTKSFIGGKMHKVSAQCFEPNAKKPFAEFEGEWNADFHWTENVNGEKRGPNEFVDTRKIPVSRKFVKSISQQEPTESRRLWKDVTENLKINDIEKATTGKRRLEQKQRDERKYREENKITYQQKLFTKNAKGDWRYNHELKSRSHST
ncbi:Oidioi.mRNA.OKI2018_I69.XSR.g14762.t1.cds [Oikopleura dioica]|uniref:Oxysterol-binding protein n=1 Tax=Oikopleura dioica TaxID=34765 RepID=A0ABN7SAT7_OIKDI|nr:Oidioi.mRNA.OKI2018_I69.XSR.g14762.t1.cds [Oikopleura dioica]